MILDLSANERFVDGVFDYNRCNFLYRIDGEEVLRREFVRQDGKPFRFDFDRDWKKTQRAFSQLETQVTQLNLQQAGRTVDKSKLATLGADYLVYRGGRASVGKVVLGSGELKDLRDRIDTAVYSTGNREITLRSDTFNGAVELVDAIVAARQAA